MRALDNLTQINPSTGKYDGINYTFGNSKTAVILAIKLSKSDKFHRVASALQDFCDGLRLLNSIESYPKIRMTMCIDWHKKYKEIFRGLITNEEGQSYLLNLCTAKFRNSLNLIKQEKEI